MGRHQAWAFQLESVFESFLWSPLFPAWQWAWSLGMGAEPGDGFGAWGWVWSLGMGMEPVAEGIT